MNNKIKTILFTLLILMAGTKAYAADYDIVVENTDGVKIYYKYINDGKELEVTSSYYYNIIYKGNVVIPEEVTYKNRTRKVTSIGGKAFHERRWLTSVTIPNSVTSIEEGAFWGCSSLTSVTIPNSVTSIEDGTFYSCSYLTSVTIGNSVTSIGDFAFSGCYSLSSVNIPNSVKSIGKYVFSYCDRLTSITIPNSVTSIGNCAFVAAPLSTIISQIENPFIITGISSNNRSFSNITFVNATLYVPKGTIDKYKATAGWKDFANIVEGNPTGIELVKDNQKEPVSYYTLDGRQINSPKSGTVVVKKQGKRIEKVLIK